MRSLPSQKLLAVFSLFILTTGICLLKTPSRTQADPGPASKSPEIAKLQQEQIATLRQACDLSEKMFEVGTASLGEANRLNHMFVEASINAAPSPKDKSQILQDALTAAKKKEDLSTTRAKAGIGTVLEPVEAKAYRLGIEIKIAEESTKSE
jgi:outer membrane protein TolC